jgi:hypothetical protein
MFTKRILGLVIGLVVTTSPCAAVQAQDGVLREHGPAEVVSDVGEQDVGSEPMQADEGVAVVEPPQEAPENPDPSQPTGANDPNYLESIGMSLEEFAAKGPTEDEINALSDVDKQDWERAKSGTHEFSVKAIDPEGDQFAQEDAVWSDCVETRFVTCSVFEYTSVFQMNFQGLRQTYKRTIYVKVKNELGTNTSTVKSTVTARLKKQDPEPAHEDITLVLTDEKGEPWSATFTINTRPLTTDRDTQVGTQNLIVPDPLKVEPEAITQTARFSSFAFPYNRMNATPTLVPSKGKIRCGKTTEASRTVNCVNPDFLPTIVFDGNDGFEHIANNIYTAIEVDQPPQPSTLTRDSTLARKNRIASCQKDREKKLGDQPDGWSCDEYPFATTAEGGKDARVQWVPESENNKQGGLVSSFYTRNQVLKGDKFIVKAVLKR